MGNFQEELAQLINKYSKENGSNTPDFILAEYLSDCLEAFNKTSKRREMWYGICLAPGRDPAAQPVPQPKEGDLW